MSATQKSIYTIPAGTPFAKTLAREIFARYGDSPETLADVTILLPTRRACRVVQEAFLHITNGAALILPRLQAIGDVDEEELTLNIAGGNGFEGFTNLPAGINHLKRQLLLARLIHGVEDFTQGFDHALVMAGALAQFMDQTHTENLNLDDLKNIVPEEYADHWQITLEFLEILNAVWPDILAEHNAIDPADRRNKLILALADYWENTQPTRPIIAAGTTGSIPAVAKLLSVIARLPNGQVILPGLDQTLDQESWNALDETHPQYGLRHVLEEMNATREDVHPFTANKENPVITGRQILAKELMRPADTCGLWTNLATDKGVQDAFKQAFTDLSLHECADEHEEAITIAIMMREMLEQPGKTAALITPDRTLARRVAMACARWDIELDDSAGQSLNQTNAGQFFILLLEACNSAIAPSALLSLLKHNLSTARSKDVQNLEIHALRGPKPKGGFAGIKKHLANNTDHNPPAKIITFLDNLEKTIKPLLELANGIHSAQTLLHAHIQTAEKLAREGVLWRGEDGEALSNLLSGLYEQSKIIPDMTLQTYMHMLIEIMRGISVRPKYGTHPRLTVLGQLEARLIDADLVIMSGLNEGSWPPDPGHDPWLSRPMRKTFGLPAYERSVGLAAHDFVQGFCAPRVAITRSLKSGGAHTIPARWLQRLSTVLEAAGLSPSAITSHPARQWAQKIEEQSEFTPQTRPAPKPPTHLRPREISATNIETWLKDPYTIYAKYVLNLKPIDPLEKQADAALRGTILHNTLHNFVKTYPAALPDNAEKMLTDMAQAELNAREETAEDWAFWWPRFDKISGWLINHERRHRRTAAAPKTETRGAINIGDFTITARADRIDQGTSGSIIIDYKSGGTYSKKSLLNGEAPQLPIEALILQENGFAECTAQTPESLEYWILTGKDAEPGTVKDERKNIEEIIERTREGLQTLINTFADRDTPYYSIPREGYEPRFNDYEHLARIKEWATLNNDSGEAA